MAPKEKKSVSSIKTFEASTKRLEEIIDTLEEEDINLAEALKAFEEGVKLSRSAHKALLQAEQQVSMLLEENGEVVTRDMADGQDQE